VPFLPGEITFPSLTRPNEVAFEDFARSDIRGDGAAKIRAGHLQFRNFLVEAIHIELLIELRHATVCEVDDDKAKGIANADNAPGYDVHGANRWFVCRRNRCCRGGTLWFCGISRGFFGTFASRGAQQDSEKQYRRGIRHWAGYNGLWG
jgi:hypothetical protein